MPNLSGRTSGHNFSLQYRNNCGEKVSLRKLKAIFFFLKKACIPYAPGGKITIH